MKKFLYLTLLCVILGATVSYAQEKDCANSKDDDGDGRIDCFDGDCVGTTECNGGYVGGDLKCEAKPSAFPKFSLALESASENGTANHLGRAVVGDIDQDGSPEMITVNKFSKKIFILNGENVGGVNKIQKSITVSFTPAYEDIAIANIDNDGCSEIFVLSTAWRLYSYDCNLNPLWDIPLSGDPGTIGLADFNGDGQVEIYARNAIYNAHTGATIVAPGTNWKNYNGGPVAVDILNDATKTAHLPADAIKDDNLELVCGGEIFSVDIAGGKINSEMKISNYGRKTEIDATSIADMNLDGSLDVVASGRNTDNDYTTIFFWDIVTGKVKTYADPKVYGPTEVDTTKACPPSTGKFYEKGWKNGTGRVNIADLDGDGKPNLAFVSGKYLYALKDDPANATNLVPLWPKVTVFEETSGNTGCTLFDFNGDGLSEIVYRDERFIYIINGTNGTIFTQQPCVSRTNREYPIVADVDGDNNTELCVTCRTVDFVQNGTITDPNHKDYYKADEANFCDINQAEYSQVRVFRSGGEPWVPARRVWNQHGYFNVNVNDNLSIPKIQQKHHVVFSENVCTTGKNRPLNSFLNQSPFLNSLGCPKYASPDLGFVQNSLSIDETIICPETDFKISFKITNIGDVSLSGTVPITFYNGDPRVKVDKLNTINVSISDLKKGAVYTITGANVEGPGSKFTLYIVLNDNGSTNPFKLPNTNFIECNYDNNILSKEINPELAPLTALKIQDNIKCEATAPDNGAVEAFVPEYNAGKDSTKNITDYTFYWSIGAVKHTGATYTKLKAGTYTVYAVHNTANCNTKTRQVVIKDSIASVNVSIKQNFKYDNCKNPNAQLEAVVDDQSKYTFIWYEGKNIFGKQAGTGHLLNNPKLMSYTVQATRTATGCKGIFTHDIKDERIYPEITVIPTDATCSATVLGKASANVKGKVAGYTFEWFKGENVKPTSDHTGPDYNNLTKNYYTVFATDNSNKCNSDTVKIFIDQSVPPVVKATAIKPYTSCDNSKPNGSASASVTGGNTGYTFQWYFGQNTNTTVVATTSTATGLKAGIYTVKATNTDTGCSDTDEVTIENKVVPVSIAVASKSHATKCEPANGSITLSVSPGNPADYKFYWYKDAVKATPDFPDTVATLSGLPSGTYFAKAVFRERHCDTQPLKVVIDNNVPTISFTAGNIIPPSDCFDNSGVLPVSVSAPGNTLGFDFEWRKGQAPFSEPAITTVSHTLNTSTASSLVAGVYTLIATNRENGCSMSKPFDLPYANSPKLIFVDTTSVTNCKPGNNGAAEIQLDPTTGTVDADYGIVRYDGKNDLGTTPSGLPGSTPDWQTGGTEDWAGLEAKFYTFVAITTNNALTTFTCRSLPLTVQVVQKTTDPVFTAAPLVNNTNCSGKPGTGEISINITNPANYTYTWFKGTDTTTPPLAITTSTASNLLAEKYTVVVEKIAGVSAGCSSSATYQLFDDTPIISIPEAAVLPTPITRCDDRDAGEATISYVIERGVQKTASDPPGDYLFTWYADPSGPAIGGTGNTLTGLTAGTYFVEAINKTSNCPTGGLVEFKIEDKTINTIAIALDSFRIPTQCLYPKNIEGSLNVTASGIGTSYKYQWYVGTDTLGTKVGIKSPLAKPLVPGVYSVRAENDLGCSTWETYDLPLDKLPVRIAASAEPLTVCFDTAKDGSVFATVTEASPIDYTFDWYVETVQDIAFTTASGSLIAGGLGVANYIVKITDINDAQCTASDTVYVADGRVFPKVVAEPLAPLTICDPTRPDGVASANVDGDILYHRFEWYTNAPPSGTSFFTGSHVSGLNAGLFSVVGVNEATGCADTTEVNIEIKQLQIPIPEIEILSQVTSCISENGALSASVNGIKTDHIFNWYIGNTEKGSPDFVGEYYDSLSVGLYSVIAIDKKTGCKSPLATEEIINDPKYPEFSITTVPTVCREDSSEPGTGFAAVFMTNSVDTDSIIWRMDGAVLATGPIVSNLDAGMYEVTVISSLGCETTRPFEVKTEIRPFNGISNNGDGQNDMFHINCIESFPSNVVKIFNRAGTMVYEAQGYDNNGTYFDGQSNRGVSIMGTNLPGGTYFYIIDKRDGSKPLAGYLEIVN